MSLVTINDNQRHMRRLRKTRRRLKMPKCSGWRRKASLQKCYQYVCFSCMKSELEEDIL